MQPAKEKESTKITTKYGKPTKWNSKLIDKRIIVMNRRDQGKEVTKER